jgi:hypothetical protein
MDPVRRDPHDGILGQDPYHFDGPADFWNEVRNEGANYRRNLQKGQPYRLELWCEAAGMVPQLRRVADRYSVGVYTCSGFNSLTSVRELADRVLYHGGDGGTTPTVLLHVGDFDPSGRMMFDAFTEDVGRFVHADRRYRYRQELYPVRVALMLEQIEAENLIRVPFSITAAKAKKHPHLRGWKHDFTVQAEALTPARLAEIVEEAILGWFEQEPYQEALVAERGERERIASRMP